MWGGGGARGGRVASGATCGTRRGMGRSGSTVGVVSRSNDAQFQERHETSETVGWAPERALIRLRIVGGT